LLLETFLTPLDPYLVKHSTKLLTRRVARSLCSS